MAQDGCGNILYVYVVNVFYDLLSKIDLFNNKIQNYKIKTHI